MFKAKPVLILEGEKSMEENTKRYSSAALPPLGMYADWPAAVSRSSEIGEKEPLLAILERTSGGKG